MPELTYRYCTTCAADQAFEVPECIDGHGPDCPEVVCVECGTALLISYVAAAAISDAVAAAGGAGRAGTERVSPAA